MTGFLDENQFILGGGRHVAVDIFQKFGRVAADEIVVGADNQRAGVRDTFNLRKISFADVDVIQFAVQITQPMK